jgi:hypothetical protein
MVADMADWRQVAAAKTAASGTMVPLRGSPARPALASR